MGVSWTTSLRHGLVSLLLLDEASCLDQGVDCCVHRGRRAKGNLGLGQLDGVRSTPHFAEKGTTVPQNRDI
jgi:hypothetical protein